MSDYNEDLKLDREEYAEHCFLACADLTQNTFYRLPQVFKDVFGTHAEETNVNNETVLALDIAGSQYSEFSLDYYDEVATDEQKAHLDQICLDIRLACIEISS